MLFLVAFCLFNVIVQHNGTFVNQYFKNFMYISVLFYLSFGKIRRSCRDVAEFYGMDICFRATKISQPTKANCDIRCRHCLLEAPPRFELGVRALQAPALPLGYGAIWSGRRDSNSRHSPWQGDALPLSHSRLCSLRARKPGKGFYGDLEETRTLDL